MHRKTAHFYKTQNGARVGDLYMSLIHTCELCRENPSQYLTQLMLHPDQVTAHPENWMPWNYRATLAALSPAASITFLGAERIRATERTRPS